MSNSRKLSDIDGRWIYWLDQLDARDYDGVKAYRVCIVVENESGYFPSGTGFGVDDIQPFYWTQEVCDKANLRRGIDLRTSLEILDSSMHQSHYL